MPTPADLAATATPSGTRRFVERRAAGTAIDAYSRAGDLWLSSLGLGTYLGPADDATDAAYAAAIAEALSLGINVLDTASNYRCQRSERAIGSALRIAFTAGVVARSEVFVASKAGFVPFDGAFPDAPSSAIQAATIGQGLCREDELCAGCHCLAPAFLRAMLRQSRANLGLQTLDLYYLHNPETQLQTLDRREFDDRLRAAFAALEAAVAAGEIAAYGVATWSGLRAQPHERDHLELAHLCRLAADVAGEHHHLRAVQLPLNLAMPEALTLRNQQLQGRALAVLDAAAELGLTVMTSAALLQGKLTRAAPGQPVALTPQPQRAQAALQFARSAPGVTTALCGMASAAHVRENARLLGQAKTPHESVVQALPPARVVALP